MPPRKKSGRRGHALDPVGKQAADICEAELDGRGLAAHEGMLADLGHDPPELVELPLLGGLDLEELVDRLRERLTPRRRVTGSPHVVDGRRQTRDEVGQATGDGDVVALDIERRDIARCEADVVVAHRHSHEHPVDRGPPRVAGELPREAPRLAVAAVEAPAHVGPGDPIRDGPEGVVVEVEALADRRQRNELQHLRGCEPARDQREERVERREDRVRLAQGAVRDTVEEPGRGAARYLGRPLRRGPEAGFHQWCELVDRRGEHDDVLLAERRVVGKQMEDRVTQHLDLADLPVARVHLDRTVVGVQLEVTGGRAAGTQVVLHAGKQGTWHTAGGVLVRVERQRRGDPPRLGRREEHRALAVGAPPRPQQRVTHLGIRRVVGAEQCKWPRANQCRLAHARRRGR